MTDRAELIGWLTAAVAGATGQDPDLIDPTLPWTAYGITSTEAVSLSGELEELLGVPLSPTLVYEHATIVDLAGHLAGPAVAVTDPGPRRAAGTAAVRGVPVLGAGTDPVCVVGMGCRFPGGDGLAAFWHTLATAADRSTVVPPERWDAEAWYAPDPDTPGRCSTRHAALVADLDGFDAAFFDLSPREALRMEPRQRMLLEVAHWALEDAGLPVQRLRGSRTGVFVGAMASSEYTDLQREVEGPGCVDDPNFGLGSASSVLAGRLSYLLDLRGPCLVTDTACSSSLVAVHLARQSLLCGEVDLAIVAGVSAVLRPQTVQNASKARMLAPDGRCKTFDAAADGFVMGEGCGVVVLERASAAAARGRRPRAVLSGSAVNQDGHSNGLTAPSGTAQRAVIRAALASAGVQPHQVGFLEAHGSGTALGDATELAALLEVFGADDRRTAPLAVGAVKTNIGHLLGAAGMAGLIKTVLATEHRQIPANLHLHTPNPAVRWDPAAVVLPAALTPWRPPGGRLVAGVSSFGWSGTNAHVVVEEPPAEPVGGAAATPAGPHLLLLSARDRSALARYARDLTDTCDGDLDLGDVAFTTQTGRSALDHRAAVVCADLAEARAGLAAVAGGRSGRQVRRGSQPPVALLLPGVGDQRVGMGQQLYRANDAFRAAVDACAAAFAGPLGLDLRLVLYPEVGAGNGTARAPDLAALLGRIPPATAGGVGPAAADGPGALDRLDVAHAAVFTVDYACAALWRDLGVVPRAVLGYSLGEYAAACLAGVFTLDAAATLVARRAQVIACAPAGAMLAVPQGAAAIRCRLRPGLSIAADNGPRMSVVAGPVDAVAELESELRAAGVVSRRIPVGQPMHTPLLAPIRDEVTRLVAAAEPRPPAVAFGANLTGAVVPAGRALPAGYWADQLCSPVRFADAVAALLAWGAQILVEAGPGQTLSHLAGQVTAGRGPALALATLPAATDPRTDLAVAVSAAGQVWCHGVDIDATRLRPPGTGGNRIVPLPSYPFTRTRFWPGTGRGVATSPNPGVARPADPGVAAQPGPGAARSVAGSGGVLPPAGKQPDLADWYHVQAWRQAPALADGTGTAAVATLLLADRTGVASRLAATLAGTGRPVATAVVAGGYEINDDGTIGIDPTQPEHYHRLLRDLAGRGLRPARVVHAMAMRMPGGPVDERVAAATMDLGFHSLLGLVRAIAADSDGPCEVVAVANNATRVAGCGVECPDQATLWGAHRSVAAEYPHITPRFVDLDLAGGDAQVVERAADCLAAELACAPTDEVVAWRHGRRWIREWVARRVPPATTAPVWRVGGSYLITGGTGGLGLAIARYLARTVRARMVLVGRSPLPAPEQWAAWLDGHGPADAVSRRILALREIAAAGGEVHVVAADCTDVAAMRAAVDGCLDRFGCLDGVLHAAGVPGGGLIQGRTAAQAAAVLAPKVHGTLVLDAVLQDRQLDFVALYSSAVVAFGGVGESDYCAANAFLDAYAHSRNTGGRYTPRWVSVGWAPWQWDAWHAGTLASGPDELRHRLTEYRDRLGISEAEGAELLTRLLATDLAHALVLPQDLATTTRQWQALLAGAAWSQPSRLAQRFPRPDLRSPFVAPRGALERGIAEIWQEFLGLERVGVDDPFFELGGNSLVGLAVVARLERQLGRPVPPASLLQHPTVRDLALALASQPGAAPPAGADPVAGDAAPPAGANGTATAAGSARGRQRAQAHAAAARRRAGRNQADGET